MAPPKRKVKRNLGGGAKFKKKPAQGRGPQRDLSSRSSGSSCSRSESSRSSGSEDESSSCGDSDEDHPSDYKKGGYHPVMPYQVYNARYRVLSKLGAGAFSTVWLCADEKGSLELMGGPQLVAMKVCKSKRSVTEQAEDEVALLDHLQQDGCSPHVVQMRSHFWHSGPNGRHKCMVFEVMGENLLALVKHFDYNGVPMAMVRRLTRHTLLGLEYIHSRGVIHTDVKLENVLVSRHDFAELVRDAHAAHHAFNEQKIGTEAMSKGQKKRLKKKQKNAEEEAIEKKEEEVIDICPPAGEALSKSQKKRMKKKQKELEAGGADDSDIEEPASGAKPAAEKANEVNDDEDSDADAAAARACGRPVPPMRQKDRFKTLESSQVFAKLADFGNGCRATRKVTDEIQTRQYRSPEVIIGAPWDETADIWSAGCMIFELITGDFLFDPSTGENWSRNEDHLALITELLGDYPPKQYALSGTYSRDFFTNAGKLKHIKNLQFWGLQCVLSSKYKLEEEEAEEIADFLSPMLAWEPKRRCSATQALKHFWVQAMPGELDVPDTQSVRPEMLDVSQGSTEADSPSAEAAEAAEAPKAEVEAPKIEEVEVAIADGNAFATAALGDPPKAQALAEEVSLSSPREALEAAATAPTLALAAVAASAPVPVAIETKPEPTASSGQVSGAHMEPESADQAAAIEEADRERRWRQQDADIEEAIQEAIDMEADRERQRTQQEADTTADAAAPVADSTPQQDTIEEAQREAWAAATTLAAAAATTLVHNRGISLETVVDLSSLDLSDCMPLVANFESGDGDDVARLLLAAGGECRRLDYRHILVFIRATGVSAVVKAAELARTVCCVTRWISLEDYVLAHPSVEAQEEELIKQLAEGGDEKPKKKNNKKKGKK